MSEFTVKIKTDNSAFSGEQLTYEVARILQKIYRQAEQGCLDGPIMDSNGNRVGDFYFIED